MAKAEGSRGELIDDASIRVRVILAVALVLHIQLQVLHRVRAEDQWEPLFVGDRLNLGNDDASKR